MFDIDRDGFISDKDLVFVVKMLTGDSLTTEELTAIVVGTLRDFDLDHDGKLSPAEFNQVRGVKDVLHTHAHSGCRARRAMGFTTRTSAVSCCACRSLPPPPQHV
jgi:hypothetical protein